ncbi:hypothetical protein [Cloacibacterium sp.]|uniref:hypothetical protein n=1 Tax=Cloacibacterium sp. TaxID=1913682 RepID=UPI0035ADCFF1
MTKELKEKYLKLGVLERHFDYAVSAVKSGTKREIILKNLTSDVRKMEKSISSDLLDDLFQSNGGEFKYENRTGYLYSSAYLLIAIICGIFSVSSLFNHSSQQFSLKMQIVTTVGFFSFSYLFVKTIFLTLRGKHRDV